jgi:SET domain
MQLCSLMWFDLVNWVEQSGGYVHKSLELRNVYQSRDGDTAIHRGLFLSKTSAAISHNEILLRLPRAAATISGHAMPSTYVDSRNSEKTAVSSWLRCIAALMLAMDHCVEKNKCTNEIVLPAGPKTVEERDVSPYILSLPASFETIWQWSEQEIEEYLAGTKPTGLDGGPNQTPNSNAWMIDPLVVRTRYETSILPYLRHCGVVAETPNTHGGKLQGDECFDRFKIACQILSTRGFFMDHRSEQRTSGNIVHDKDPTEEYSGPYLLPVVDLINHADHGSVGNNAKLELLDREDVFVIRAAAIISPDTEILHSYGDHLSTYQFLLSFGFVPWNRVQRAMTLNNSVEPFEGSVVISKQDIWESCWHVIESGLPQKLSTIIDQLCLEDETWEVVVDRSRTANSVPNDIEIRLSWKSDNGTVRLASESLLCDELVTAACIPFLPTCAYAEIAFGSLLDHTVLQDYFLGQLVGAALVRTIQQRFLSYKPIPLSTSDRVLSIFKNTVNETLPNDDFSLLQYIATVLSNNIEDSGVCTCNRGICRLAYGLTIRIEEKTTLEALLKLVSSGLDNLGGEDGGYEDSSDMYDEKNLKKLKASKD